MKKTVFVLTIIGVFMLSGIGQVSAYTIDQNTIPGTLGAHHKEMTITAEPGEIVYLPIPRQNFPVNMQVTVPEFFTPEGSSPKNGPYAMSFVVADIQGSVTLSRPQTSAPYNDQLEYYAFGILTVSFPLAEHLFGVYAPRIPGITPAGDGIEVYQQTDVFVVGSAVPEAGMPSRILLGIPNPSRDVNGTPLYGPITFYVSVWY